MFTTLPKTVDEIREWDWQKFHPYFEDLEKRELTAENISQWLDDYTKASNLLFEFGARLNVAKTVDTTDEKAEADYKRFFEEIYPPALSVSNKLDKKLLDSSLQPENFEIPLKKIRTQVEIFREENIPLQTEERKLGIEYDKIIGAQTVEWEGEEKTLIQLSVVFQDKERTNREKAWDLMSQRQLKDRAELNELWVKLLKLRQDIAKNAGFENYRDYVWKQKNRFDYTPEDALKFCNAIAQVVVPASVRILRKRGEKLGLPKLSPWDLEVDVGDNAPLKPFEKGEELESKSEAIFRQVDPQLGDYFATMRQEKLLDLENRKGKAPGGYCTFYPVVERPFIFMNSVGVHRNVQTMLHEAGHAFHGFEATKNTRYMQQRRSPMEFSEVASMAMELLASPYLTKDKGGFYNEKDAARAQIEHLEQIIRFWPYMAVIVSFQHWAYNNVEDALDPEKCDTYWQKFWHIFMRGVDYQGLDEWVKSGWQRRLHIYRVPFYYIEYGLAQLGSVQIWANSLKDQSAALENYRKALALGGTVDLPTLYQTAGAKFAFDAATLIEAVDLIEKKIDELEAVL